MDVKKNTYRVQFNNWKNNEWKLVDVSTLLVPNFIIKVEPNEYKLFTDDVIELEFNESEDSSDESKIQEKTIKKCEIVHSKIRCTSQMPGVIIIEGNETYGKVKDRFIYKCIPDDKRLPIFMVPYLNKELNNFSKKISNKYISFKYDNWETKRPFCSIQNIIGDVNDLPSFYEYQLYCKSLNDSIQEFTKNAINELKKKTESAYIQGILDKNNIIEDRTNSNIKIFSIDSETTTDYDDALSIECFERDEKKEYKISIYIADVPVWMDELNLWSSFTRRVSTIYLPDRKRPMLPTVLSDSLCSLREGEKRFSFIIEFRVIENEIINIEFHRGLIKVYKNYSYESEMLLNDENYKMMYEVTHKLSRKYKYGSKIKNSYDVVSYLMILMNYHSSLDLMKYENGIYRHVILNKEYKVPENLPDELSTFLKIWNGSAGQYTVFKDMKQHDFLDLDSYIHITSPIRRLVDLLNIIQMFSNRGMMKMEGGCLEFFNHWNNNLDYINVTMRAIRKIQNACNLLDLCSKNEYNELQYDGYLFDKMCRDDGLFSYMAFIPEIKIASRIVLRFNYEEYSILKFKIYLFKDEINFKKKIRLQVV